MDTPNATNEAPAPPPSLPDTLEINGATYKRIDPERLQLVSIWLNGDVEQNNASIRVYLSLGERKRLASWYESEYNDHGSFEHYRKDDPVPHLLLLNRKVILAIV
jgi:hypothetical protein